MAGGQKPFIGNNPANALRTAFGKSPPPSAALISDLHELLQVRREAQSCPVAVTQSLNHNLVTPVYRELRRCRLFIGSRVLKVKQCFCKETRLAGLFTRVDAPPAVSLLSLFSVVLVPTRVASVSKSPRSPFTSLFPASLITTISVADTAFLSRLPPFHWPRANTPVAKRNTADILSAHQGRLIKFSAPLQLEFLSNHQTTT